MKTVEEITNKVFCGDARLTLKEFPSESIDMCITSPPFFRQRHYNLGDAEIGWENDYNMYLNKLRMVFDQVKRVLKPRGTCWVNMGDKYKNGELYLIPHDFVLEMQSSDWRCFNEIIWHKCLSGNTKLIVSKDGRIDFIRVEDLYKNSLGVKVPSQYIDGSLVWVDVSDIVNTGYRELVKITTKSGRSVTCTPDHRFVVKGSTTTVRKGGSSRRRSRKLRLKLAGELTKSDYIYVNVNLLHGLPEPSSNDYNDGFVVGFFIAEGNWIYNKWKKPVGVQLSCGLKDIDRGYIDYFSTYNIKTYIYGNNVCVRSYDNRLIELVEKSVIGNVCNEKYLKSIRNIEFSRGALDGFLSGDGHLTATPGLWRVGIKPNEELNEQLCAMCRLVGYDYRYHSTRVINGGYRVMSMSIRKNMDVRNVFMDCIVDRVEKIEPVGIGDCYDMSVESIYWDRSGNQSTARSKEIYNNIYFLGNGMWTHNSNVFTSSSKKRFIQDFEYLFAFAKQDDYYFEQQYEPYKTKYKSFEYNGQGKKDYKSVGAQDPSEAKRSILRSMSCGIGRHMRCVWSITHKPSKYTATFPRKLIEAPIRAGCPPGGIVLDPFIGSGIAARVAVENGRNYVGVDLNPRSIEMTKELVNLSC